MPTRSAGCFACRRRKIGCDQTKPGCKKCDIHGIPCPGYRSDNDKALNVVIYQAAPQPRPERSPSYGSSTSSDRVTKRSGSSSSDSNTGSESQRSTTTASSSSSSSPLLQSINCVPQNRLQAVSVAMSKLVPAGESVETALDLMNIAPFYFMQIRQPVLVAAMDTLALVQLGTSYKDKGVLVQAQRSYGKCLLLLLQTISSMPKGVVWDEQIASAVLVIALAGAFDVLHQAQNLVRHGLGLRQLLESRGPKPLENRFEATVFHQARQIMIYHSGSLQKKCFLEEPAWMEVSKSAPGRDESWEFLDIAIRWPGFLERAVGALQACDPCQQYTSAYELSAFLEEINDFDQMITAKQAMPSSPCKLDRYDFFNSCLDGDETFTDVHDCSPSWRYENVKASINLHKAMALKTLMRILIADPVMTDIPPEVMELELELDATVIDLCRRVPAIIGRQVSFMGMIAASPCLRFAVVYFQERQRQKELDWCMKVARKMNQDGLAMAGGSLW